jgi:hypothetical protein
MEGTIEMYPSQDARELAILLRISRELDIVGDISAIVDNPSELVAWASILHEAVIVAWRAEDSGHRYLQVTADHDSAPIRGRVAAVLLCEEHPEFWKALCPQDLRGGETRAISRDQLSSAWSEMPLSPPDSDVEHPAPPT